MFIIMKTLLLLSLLCGTFLVNPAAAVPVEAGVQEEQVSVSFPVEDVVNVLEEQNAEVASPDENTVPEEPAELAATDDKEEVRLKVLSQDIIKQSGAPPSPVTPERIPSNCPRGWHGYLDNCYLMVNYSYTWSNADYMCENMGASLASAHSLWEYSFLKQLAWRAGFLTAWIGGYRFQGYWKWDDGTQFDYNNWYYQTSSSSYDCIYLNSQDTRGWSGERCSLTNPFICSMKVSYCQQ